MAAKNKFKGRGRNSISREDADVQDLLGLHLQARLRAEEVEEQIQELHAAGKFPEARVLRMHALGIQQGLRAIEAEVRSYVRPAKFPRPSLAPTQQTRPQLDGPGVNEPGVGITPASGSMFATGDSMLAPAGGRTAAMPAAPLLSPALMAPARPSLGANFETTMDAGIPFEITR
jgi:hypothetical protein